MPGCSIRPRSSWRTPCSIPCGAGPAVGWPGTRFPPRRQWRRWTRQACGPGCCAPGGDRAGPLISNDAVAAIIARYPGRFAGVAAVDLARPMDAVRELRRCVRDLGFRALRVVPWLWNLPPSDRRYYPLHAECVELGIPFCLQVGHTGPLCPSEPGRPIPYPGHVALDFPHLKIVA